MNDTENYNNRNTLGHDRNELCYNFHGQYHEETKEVSCT